MSLARIALLLSPLVMTACFSKDSSDDDDDDDGGGNSGWDLGGSDTGSGEDDGGSSGDGGGGDGGGGDGGGGDGGGGDGGGGGSATCSSIAPLDDSGLELVYDYNSSSYSGSYTTRNLGSSTYRGEDSYLARTTQHITGSGYTSDTTTEYHYRCDGEGVWLLGGTIESVTVSSGYETEYWQEVHYTTPGLIAPKSIAVGDRWTFSYASSYTDSYGNSGTYSDAFTYEVIGSESKTVEAGTFDTFRIAPSSGYEYLVAEDVGMVWSPDTELVEVN